MSNIGKVQTPPTAQATLIALKGTGTTKSGGTNATGDDVCVAPDAAVLRDLLVNTDSFTGACDTDPTTMA